LPERYLLLALDPSVERASYNQQWKEVSFIKLCISVRSVGTLQYAKKVIIMFRWDGINDVIWNCLLSHVRRRIFHFFHRNVYLFIEKKRYQLLWYRRKVPLSSKDNFGDIIWTVTTTI
jgi:hypothetical protein